MPPNWQPQDHDHFYEMGHVSQPASPPSGFHAVKNVWYARTRAHVTQYRRFYTIIAGLTVCAIIAFTLLGVLLPRSLHSGGGGDNNSEYAIIHRPLLATLNSPLPLSFKGIY